MKIKHFIVTYKNALLLEQCIRSILNTDAGEHQREIFVINNHSQFSLPDDLGSRVSVIHNAARPDFSTGHLSRNWNQSLILGFESLTAPKADIVICSQNDSIFAPNYLSQLIARHATFDIITQGIGDNAVSYTPAGVRQVGLWDERFCNIGYQEADYFLRLAKYLRGKASINDVFHGRVLNPIPDIIITQGETGFKRGDPAHMASMAFHAHSRKMFLRKWNLRDPEKWSDISSVAEQIDSYVLYPYFEKDVLTLRQQRFAI